MFICPVVLVTWCVCVFFRLEKGHRHRNWTDTTKTTTRKIASRFGSDFPARSSREAAARWKWERKWTFCPPRCVQLVEECGNKNIPLSSSPRKWSNHSGSLEQSLRGIVRTVSHALKQFEQKKKNAQRKGSKGSGKACGMKNVSDTRKQKKNKADQRYTCFHRLHELCVFVIFIATIVPFCSPAMSFGQFVWKPRGKGLRWQRTVVIRTVVMVQQLNSHSTARTTKPALEHPLHGKTMSRFSKIWNFCLLV